MVGITIELNIEQAEVLAQFCKRVLWETFRAHTKTEHDAYIMQAAVGEVEKELNRLGYAPR
jgi:hypothetical protein